ncbi:MAG: hypothetical protein NZ529_09840, partial [Cytophagaceae bacterium]|nr:hypothetical protein [Cytophagaceae bacterium]MDW8457086.1 hypothetical protein [Cytophagaceae bacterium]
MKKLKFVKCLLFSCFVSFLHAQHGAIDPTFNPTDIGFGNGDGVIGDVYTYALQPDGKILIGGYFSHCDGVLRPRIARLNANGMLDQSFDPGGGANYFIKNLALQPDGKILIGGWFTEYDGTPRNCIARLNPDGSLDQSFDPGSGANNHIHYLALQPDGKILIGGWFSSYNGVTRNRIARINSDGSLDASFDPGSGVNDTIHSFILQPDGKILIFGNFTSYNGTTRKKIARLHADGTLDLSFDAGTGANDQILSYALQPDGKILIGGWFTAYNGTPRKYIARLNPDGSLDHSFDPGLGPDNLVNNILLQPDGKILIEGGFLNYNNTPRRHIARLNPDGSLDQIFKPYILFDSLFVHFSSGMEFLTVLSDGKILVKNYVSYTGLTWCMISRLNPDGSLDTSFNHGSGVNAALEFYAEISTLALKPDGKILIGGWFNRYNGIPRNCMAQLNADGSLDQNFIPDFNTDTQNVYLTGMGGVPIALQPDGKILVAGSFIEHYGTIIKRVARLNSNGSLDTSFYLGSGANDYITTLALQPDGKILIGGKFTEYNGITQKYITRLNPNGSLDMSFDPGSGANDYVSTFALQPDGKILIGGEFTEYNGTARNYIALLNPDGSLDMSFDPGSGANDYVSTFALQPDG